MSHISSKDEPTAPAADAAPSPQPHAPLAPQATDPFRWTTTPALRYSAAVLAVALTWALRTALDPYLGELQPFTLFFVPVLLMGCWAGSGPATLAALLGWLVGDWFFSSPGHAIFAGGHQEFATSLVFISISAALIAITHHLCRARTQVETILHSITDAFFSLNRQWRFTYVNPEAQRLLRLPAAQLFGHTIWQLLPEAEPFRRRYDQALATGQAVHFKHFYPPHQAWIEFHAYPSPAGLSVYFRDITQSKRAQDALRDNETRLRLAIETAELGSYERNLITNQVIANEVCRKLLGVPEGPLTPDTAPGSVHPEDRPRILAAVQRAFDPDLREVCAGKFRIVTPAGVEHWVYGRGRVLFDDSAKPPRPYKFHGVLLDITEQKQTEEALQRQTLHLQLLQQATARLLLGQQPMDILHQLHNQMAQALGVDAFMLFQPGPVNGHLRLRACAGVTEDQRRKLETLRYGRAICAKPSEALQPIIATHLQTVQAPNRRFIRKLGFRCYLYYPLILNNRLHGTVAFASRQRDDYDRTDLDFFHAIAGTLAEALERERLEAELHRHAANLDRLVRERTASLREAVAELEGFSYSLIHDLRAPLRAMHSYASLIELEAAARLQPRESDLLRRLKTAAGRMDQLITDSLNYSRILRRDLPLGPLNLRTLLSSIIETYPNLHPAHADIQIEFGDLLVHGNQAALTQVFGNLLDNAVKFVAPGVRPRVRIRAEHRTRSPQPSATPPYQPEPVVLVWVEDNGIGIPKEAQENIFGMFQRMHREDEYRGTGIGLAIVKKCLDRTGGRVCVDSELGKGSRFVVELPIPSPA